MSARVTGHCRQSFNPPRSRTGPAPDSVVHTFLLGLVSGPDLTPAARDLVLDHLDTGYREIRDVAQQIGCTERTVNRRRTTRVQEWVQSGRLKPGDPWPYQNSELYTVGTCGHRMPRRVWLLGHRSCSRCLVADLMSQLQNETEVAE